MDDRTLRPGPGKTAPRLINDLLDYDPSRPNKFGRNLLSGDAPIFKNNKIQLLRKGYDDCHHALMKKVEQTSAPVSRDEQPGTSTKYVVATYCANCLYHFDITVDFRRGAGRRVPCNLSDSESPLHHLRLVDSINSQEFEERQEASKYKTLTEAHRWECSGATCPVVVEIKISPPRLNKKLLSTVTDAKKVDARGRRVIQEAPDRFVGWGPMVPLLALINLRTYLKDAKEEHNPDKLKKIAKRNKKLLLGFADDCDDLFEYLDFKVVEERGSDPDLEDVNYFWQLPIITDINRDFIDDVICELDTTIANLSTAAPQKDLKSIHIPVPALKDIERSLGYSDYPTRSRTVDLSIEEHPWYSSLGAVDQFTDEFLSWAYDRQCECDPANKPYYLDCLMGLAKGRGSPDLETKVVMATSAGEHGLEEIEAAYNFLTIDPNTTEDDDYIIGRYKTRIEAAPRQKDEARQCLRTIASARKSTKIETVANDQSMTISEALELLHVSEDTSSDSIQAAAVVQVMDGGDKSRVIRALKVISVHRKGDYVLEAAAATMESGGEQTLALSEAYSRLQIGDRNVPDETVLTYYQSLTNDAPAGSKESFTEALRAIALERSSTFLLMKLDDPDADVQATRTTSEEPVGLENIGNTCYLNSLLQFYYTVKPVRDVVMNFDSYRVDSDDADINNGKKRVGGRVVDRAEIVKAQKFVEELQGLYKNLRTASTRSVKPTTQLAKSTFTTKTLEKTFREYRKQSISSPNGPPPLSVIFEGPVYGPEAPPPLEHGLPTPDEDKDIAMIDRPKDDLDNGDDSSETTLIELEEETDQLPPYDATQGHRLFPMLEKEESGNEIGDDAVMVNGDHLDTDSIYPAPPENPPPVPPRNKAGLSIQTRAVKDVETENDGLWQFGTQQDVTEVMGNVMDLLSCAIKPNGITKLGTQTDKIYDTFFGDNAVYSQKPGKLEKQMETWSNLMVYPDDKKSRDIYEALDVNYDAEYVEISNNQVPQYRSITKLPPVLQIQIQRTSWNRGLSASAKNSNPVVFPETIYLDRYMDSDDPDSDLMKRRRQAWKWKTELRTLEARQSALQTTEAEMSVPDALLETKNFITALQEEEIQGLDINPSIVDLLDSRMAEVAHELDFISHKINIIKDKLNGQFADLHEYEYRLQTVFIHRGEAGGGHYWIYLYDFDNDIWREYNDEYVTVVKDTRRIFEQQGGATPYCLAYVRSADQKDLVNAVFRDVKEPEMAEVTVSWAEKMEENLDQENEMMDEDDHQIIHVEHAANPRPILPKPASGKNWTADDSNDSRVDVYEHDW